MEETIVSKEDVARKVSFKDGISLFIAEEVLSLLEDEKFIEDWESLYYSCEWSNAFLSPSFAKCFYEVFEKEFTPLLIAQFEKGRLKALLPLNVEAEAIMSQKTFKVKGVGFHYAEYQGWLAEKGLEVSFIKDALKLLLKTFPTAEIHLKYLPAKIPVDWVKESEWSSKCALQKWGRPLMRMNDPELPKFFKKRSYKTKLNRLKRSGKLEFKEVTGRQEFLDMLPGLALQFDFRQGAMFNKKHFQDNPKKTELMTRLFDAGLLHSTILTLDGEIIASIIAVTGQNWIHLGGINTHSPEHAVHSPGFVHFVLLSELLSKDENMVFDLTPGGDEYKERLATDRDVTYGLIISNNRKTILTRKARVEFDEYVLKQGKRPVSVENDIRKELHIWKQRAKNLTKGNLARLLDEPKVSQKNTLTVRKAGATNSTAAKVSKNNLEDLLLYSSDGNHATRWEALIHFMKSMERGEDVYSVSDGSELLACIWVASGKAIAKNEVLSPIYSAEDNLMYHFYCKPNYREQFGDFFKAVVDQLHKEGSIKALFSKKYKFLINDLDCLTAN
ncbi:GNAT family N-acetyltransferase [Litoribacter alkaliphilus]|uniref:GNAT family N-acetyltransferase n=1 Tax=Litoribacter ruber TaxID=702568 RepID=A0AAP2CIG1_9BACT|nr:GNAT family N-acetyltransferase [Litoribacter alkaliphilus]MBS9524259.1 GNAT family N-acetyltransferase [Litoribacter alkaliphilus]